MNTRFKVFFLIGLVLLFSMGLSVPRALAGYGGKRWTLGTFGSGGLGRLGAFQTNHDDYRFFNVMGFVSYQFSSLVEGRLAGGIDRYIGIREFDLFSLNQTGAERNDWVVATELGILFHFLLKKPDRMLNPYVLTGIRVLGINPIVGIGSQFKLHERLSLFVEASFNSMYYDSKIEGRGGVMFHF